MKRLVLKTESAALAVPQHVCGTAGLAFEVAETGLNTLADGVGYLKDRAYAWSGEIALLRAELEGTARCLDNDIETALKAQQEQNRQLRAALKQRESELTRLHGRRPYNLQLPEAVDIHAEEVRQSPEERAANLQERQDFEKVRTGSRRVKVATTEEFVPPLEGSVKFAP
jgi:hypothetical protein